MPGPDDDQLTWIQFALTFDWYAEKGTHEACAAFADAVRDRWEQAGTLPVGLNDLRAALFFEQRRWCWSNEGPFNDNEWRYWRSLVEAIRHELPYDDRLPPEPCGIKDPIVGPGEVAGVRTNAEEATIEPSEAASAKTTAEEATVVASAGKQVIDLYSQLDTHGGTRCVWLRLTGEGNLTLEGQDHGGAAEKFWGASEYQWAWSLHPDRLVFFLELLGVDASAPADLLESIGAALNALDRTEIEKMFKAAGATFWSRAGE